MGGPSEVRPTCIVHPQLVAPLQTTPPDAERGEHLGQYVAVLKSQVVSHDADQGALFIRVRRRYPNTLVLITDAEARRPREFVRRSPRLERME